MNYLFVIKGISRHYLYEIIMNRGFADEFDASLMAGGVLSHTRAIQLDCWLHDRPLVHRYGGFWRRPAKRRTPPPSASYDAARLRQKKGSGYAVLGS
jgi:hypothetical protein